MKNNLRFLMWLGMVLFLSAISKTAFAEFSLAVRPYEGGFDLRYGKLDPSLGRVNKEVTVQISSDIGKQYRLVQTLIEPLSIIQGVRLSPANFSVYAINGSNRFGTLSVEQEAPVGLGRQIIYTSNQSGVSDSFTLVYGINTSGDIEPGNYSGRISFTLEAVDSSQTPAIAILNVYAEIEVQSAIEITTLGGSKTITLNADNRENVESGVTVNIKGGFGRQFRISQAAEQPVSSEGNLLSWDAVKFMAHNAQKGTAVNEYLPLTGRQQVIYTSSARGEADNFAVDYALGDLTKEKSGRYRAQIKYVYENMSTGQTNLIDTILLEVENPRVFDLSVSPEVGGLIQFRDVKASGLPRIQEVTFAVNTNIGKRYQVTQNTLNLLTNKEGASIPEEHFTLRQEKLDTKGILKYPGKTSVKQGQMVLFMSDENGSPDKFKVIYELSLPQNARPGDYATTFTYSVSEI